MDPTSVDTAAKAAALLERAPLAVVGVLALAGLVWVYLAKEKLGREHRLETLSRESRHSEELRLLNEKHAAELKQANEARFTLAVAFEGTIRELIIAAKAKRRNRRNEKAGPE